MCSTMEVVVDVLVNQVEEVSSVGEESLLGSISDRMGLGHPTKHPTL